MNNKDKYKIKQVLFDPAKVGWDTGLRKAVDDTKRFSVPLAVLSQTDKERVLGWYPEMEVILDGE